MKNFFEYLKFIEPGIAVAATGVGAGDMIAASVSGAKYGIIILWAAAYGAVLKYFLNEGVARWQIGTGTTLLEGWLKHTHKIVPAYFLIYLVLWSFIVAGALISACGLAAHAMYPGLSVEVWGIIHSLMGLLLVYIGRYKLFELLMKIFIAVMFVTIVYSAVIILPEITTLITHISIPLIPEGSAKFILGVLGGVGGSVTILSYGYWIREKGITSRNDFNKSRFDLAVAYILTGLFGAAVIIIAAGVSPETISGSKMVLSVAEKLGEVSGESAKWIFIVGFWGAVFTSLLGVWQGIPYLFADFMITFRKKSNSSGKDIQRSTYYNAYLFYLAIPPLLLLLIKQPVWIIMIYTVSGALFMPFLAGVLLYMNNKKELIGDLKNSRLVNLFLIITLLLFAFLSYIEIEDFFK
jgi:Mn2+/Fe2+ NRAMP family transporter